MDQECMMGDCLMMADLSCPVCEEPFCKLCYADHMEEFHGA